MLIDFMLHVHFHVECIDHYLFVLYMDMNRVIPEEACALEIDNDNISILICLIEPCVVHCSLKSSVK